MRTKLNVECQLERVRYRERQTKEGYVQYTGLNQENAGVQVGICTPPMLEYLTFVINVYFTCLVIRNLLQLSVLWDTGDPESTGKHWQTASFNYKTTILGRI